MGASSQLTPEELAAHSELLDTRGGAGDAPEGAPHAVGQAGEYYKVLARDSWLESKVSMGGTALPRVREQLASARAVLGQAPVV